MGNRDSAQRNSEVARRSESDDENSENQRMNDRRGLFDALLNLKFTLNLLLKKYTCDEWKNKNLKFSDLAKASNPENKPKYDQIQNEIEAKEKLSILAKDLINTIQGDNNQDDNNQNERNNNNNDERKCKNKWFIKCRLIQLKLRKDDEMKKLKWLIYTQLSI